MSKWRLGSRAENKKEKAIKLNSRSCVTLKMVRWTDGRTDDGLQPWKSRKIRLRKDSLVLASAEFFEISCRNLRYKGKKRWINGLCQTEKLLHGRGKLWTNWKGNLQVGKFADIYLIIRSINVIDTMSRMYNEPLKPQEMATHWACRHIRVALGRLVQEEARSLRPA